MTEKWFWIIMLAVLVITLTNPMARYDCYMGVQSACKKVEMEYLK